MLANKLGTFRLVVQRAVFSATEAGVCIGLKYMEPREIPGFSYDPTTNRYYRDTTRQQVERAKRDAQLKRVNAFLQRIITRKELDTTQGWVSLGGADQLPQRSFQSYTNVPSLTTPVLQRAPIVVVSTGSIFPSDLLGEAILYTTDATRLTLDGKATGLYFPSSPSERAPDASNRVTMAYPHAFLYYAPDRDYGICYSSYAYLRPDVLSSSRTFRITGETSVMTFSQDRRHAIMDYGRGTFWHWSQPPSNDDDRVEILRRDDSPYSVREVWGQIRALSYVAASDDQYLAASAKGNIYLIHHQRQALASTLCLPQDRCARQLWTDKGGQTVYAHTFHGELFMIDVRYPRAASCLLSLGELSGGERLCGGILLCSGREHDRVVYGAIDEHVLGFDLRRSGIPHTAWSAPGYRFNSLCAFTDTDGLEHPLLTATTSGGGRLRRRE